MKLPLTAEWSEPNRQYRLRDANGEIVAHTRGHTEALLAALNALPACKEALTLAQLWLANCVPVVNLPKPEPLPSIAAALKLLEDLT